MLIHAASVFENGALLSNSVSGIPAPDIQGVANTIDRLLCSAKAVYLTPYVLAEFCNLANCRLGLKDSRLERFLNIYHEFFLKTREWQCKKEDLIAFKKSLKFCFTDSSVAFASKENGIPLLSIDGKLVNWCKSQGIDAKHLYYEIYLSEMQ